MSRVWQVGDVAEVTFVDGGGRGPVVRVCCNRWIDLKGQWVPDSGVRDVQHVLDLCRVESVAIIDPEDREAVERLADTLVRGDAYVDQIDNLQRALREYANPTPPPCSSGLSLSSGHVDCDEPVGHRGLHRNHDADLIWGVGVSS